ncbi:MAG: MBL fold metallo-hydrolase [Panacagrimonas sp.]
MRIKVLGCSGGVGPDLRTTSLLIDDTILIDAGTGIGDLSLAQMRRIGHIFLTHSHLDHVCGLAFMADNLFDLIEKPLEIIGIEPTLRAVRDHIFNWSIWPDFSQLPTPEEPIIKFREIELQSVQEIGGLRLRPFEVRHSIPAIGYAVEGPEGVFVFTGDTGASRKLWRFLNSLERLDRLMIEIAFPNEQADLSDRSGHYTPALLGNELGGLRHRPQIFLTHHKPGCEALIVKQCVTALAGWDYRHLRRGDIISI